MVFGCNLYIHKLLGRDMDTLLGAIQTRLRAGFQSTLDGMQLRPHAPSLQSAALPWIIFLSVEQAFDQIIQSLELRVLIDSISNRAEQAYRARNKAGSKLGRDAGGSWPHVAAKVEAQLGSGKQQSLLRSGLRTLPALQW